MKKIITTDKRGVFFGTIIEHDRDKNTCVLTDAQMCVYWSTGVRGVLGLAATGPDKESRVTKAIPRIELNGITSVMDVTDDAQKAWEACPWR